MSSNNNNNSKKNISISSLLSPNSHSIISEQQKTPAMSAQRSSFYDPINNTITASPTFKSNNNKIMDGNNINNNDDGSVSMVQNRHSRRPSQQSSALPLPSIQQQQQQQQVQAPSQLTNQRSTKVSLMSIMNTDNPSVNINSPALPSVAAALTPQHSLAAAPQVKAKAAPASRKPRANRPAIAPAMQDLNTTIIIDGKPVVIPAMAAAPGSQAAPARKRARPNNASAGSKNVKTSGVKKPVTKSSDSAKSAIIATAVPNTKPGLVVPGKSIKRGTGGGGGGSRPKSSTPAAATTTTANTTMPSASMSPASTAKPTPPAEAKPIISLDPPKLVDVKQDAAVGAVAAAVESQDKLQPDINRMDPLAAKKTVEKKNVMAEPIISLHIPLVAPGQPAGSAQVVFNVTKLCEDKYGWKAIHPDAKFAMDELNEDDDMDDMEDDDDIMDDDVSVSEREKIRERERLERLEREKEEKEKPKKKELSFEAKMNRKIGKYDYEDPFIDDAELLWDAQQVSTKDGFFVYYGPLFEEGQNPRIEKADSNNSNRSRPSGNGGISAMSSHSGINGKGPALTVNGKPIGNPHRAANGRFAGKSDSPTTTTNATSETEKATGLVSIMPKSRTSTPPV